MSHSAAFSFLQMASAMPVQGEHICAIQGSAVAGPHLGVPTGMQSRISSAAHHFVTQNQD